VVSNFIHPQSAPQEAAEEAAMSNIRETVVQTIYDVCRPERPDLSDHARPLLDCGLDSLDFSSVLMAIEDSFQISIAEEDLPSVGTIDRMVYYIEERTSGA
jgi:acyl carrier protein